MKIAIETAIQKTLGLHVKLNVIIISISYFVYVV